MYDPKERPTRAGDGLGAGRGAGKPARKSRRCLSCAQWFDSAGVEERVCLLCKAGEDWADAMAACHGHIAW